MGEWVDGGVGTMISGIFCQELYFMQAIWTDDY